MFGKIRRASGKRHPSSGGALAAFVLLSGCAADFEGRRLGGVEWVAIDINGTPAAGLAAPTLRFDGGQASGSGGCNRFTAAYRTQSNERIDISGLSSTRMACEPTVTEQERRYFSILEGAQGYNFYANGNLSLIAGDGRAIRFRSR